jgi:hypothetical protein
MINNIKSLVRKYLHFASQLKPHYFYSEISKIKRCDVLLFCHDVDRGLTLNGLAYSPLIDSIYEEFTRKKIKCQAISLPWSRLGLNKTANKSLLFNRNYLLQLVKNKILNSKNFDAYESIFIRSQAKIVLGIGLTSDLCLAAKKYNITTIELLHGMGYTFIPWGWDVLDVNKLPSKILTLDDVSKEAFKPLESKGVSIIKVPHPFYKKINNPKYALPAEWNYIGRKDKKNILFTLQWGYDGDLSELSGILNNGIFYDELEFLIKKRNDFFWHFRLHPVQLNSNKTISYVRGLSEKYNNVDWEQSSAVPLMSVASVCDVHITMSSMSCYDVSVLGLPSLVLCPTTRGDGYYKDYFSDLVEEGYVTKMILDVVVVEKWVDTISKKSPRSLEKSGDTWDDLLLGLIEYEML